MRTNIVIDDELLNEAFSVSNSKTKKDLIHEALREFIRLKNRQAPDPAGFEVQKDKIVQQLRGQKGFGLYNTFLARLRADSEVNIKPEFIE